MKLDFPVPPPDEVIDAHRVFEEREPQATEYWIARERTQNGIRDGDSSEIADAIAAFLKSWNKVYYRWRPAKARTLVADLQQLITEQLDALGAFFGRSLTELADSDRPPVLRLFSSFEAKLDAVGTAKALNLLVPSFFPLWDNAIAYQSGVLSDSRGYFLFMALTAHQVRNLAGKLPERLDPLKTLDEFNYCRFTKGWMD